MSNPVIPEEHPLLADSLACLPNSLCPNAATTATEIRMDLIKGTPCEAAIEKAMQLARQILAGEI